MATDGWLSTIGSHRVIVVRRRLSCCDFMVYLSVGIVIRGQTSINFHLGVGNGWRLLGCNSIVFQSLNALATQFLNDVGINQYSLNSAVTLSECIYWGWSAVSFFLCPDHNEQLWIYWVTREMIKIRDRVHANETFSEFQEVVNKLLEV